MVVRRMEVPPPQTFTCFYEVLVALTGVEALQEELELSTPGTPDFTASQADPETGTISTSLPSLACPALFHTSLFPPE